MKKLLCVHDVADPKAHLDLMKTIKSEPLADKHLGEGKTLGLVFFNPSLRTRLSSQKAAKNLGMEVLVMNVGSDGWALEMEDGVVMNGTTQEHIKEAVGVLSTYCDIIGVRSFGALTDSEEDEKEKVLSAFDLHATVPIISLESATGHPLQAWADMLTIVENSTKPRPKVVLTWAPHPKALPQAVANSFVDAMKCMDADFVVACPEGMELSPERMKGVEVIHNQEEAFQNADFVYAKNWSSYSDYGAVNTENNHWTVSSEKLDPETKFMHCLPVRRNVVVADTVLDSPASLVLQQAENRVYSMQAVLHKLLSHGE